MPSPPPPPPPPPALDELQQLRLERLGAHLVVRVDAKQLQSLDDLRPAKGLLAHLGRSRHLRGHRPCAPAPPPPATARAPGVPVCARG